ncbi:hypothetical protein DENSPDRAFT_494360 [Dentipellis sp. KUC8613]|nr:hypothetical protein DENSPDRAFT_494360 [Dentipellis sp. KUC8613]
MNGCPPEIHALIFSFACTDDGSVGRALSCVSRYVRQVSAPYQWQSLVISGVAQTKVFAAALDNEGRAYRRNSPIALPRKRQIHHLFISNRTHDSAEDQRYASLYRIRDVDARRKMERQFDADAEAWTTALRRILAYSAKSVRTLAMICYDIHASSSAAGRLLPCDLKKTAFPRLQALTIRGGFDVRLREPCAPARRHPDGAAPKSHSDLAPLPSLPALARLHLIAPLPFEHLLRHLRGLAPRIAHLRLSELSPFEGTLARQIFCELAERDVVPCTLPGLGARRHTADAIEWSPVVPPQDMLRRVVLQPARMPPEPERQCGCCSGYYRMNEMTQLLHAMADQAKDESYVFLSPTRYGAAGYTFRDVLKDWLDGVGGGVGGWEEKSNVGPAMHVAHSDPDQPRKPGTRASLDGCKEEVPRKRET